MFSVISTRTCNALTQAAHWSKSRSTESGVTTTFDLDTREVTLTRSDGETPSGQISGFAVIEVKKTSVELENVKVGLELSVAVKRAVRTGCTNCSSRRQVQSCRLITDSMVLTQGIHKLPFTMELSSHLPSSLSTPTARVAYRLVATASFKQQPHTSTPIKKVTAYHELAIRYIIMQPVLPRYTSRIFRATGIQVHTCVDAMRIGARNKVCLELSQLESLSDSTTSHVWRIIKVDWKLEELVRTAAPTCEAHGDSGGGGGDGGSGLNVTTKTRHLLDGRSYKGWNYTSDGDCATVELDILPSAKMSFRPALNYTFGDRCAVEVTHVLTVEIVVAKDEMKRQEPSSRAYRTGVARFMTLQYPVHLVRPERYEQSVEEVMPPPPPYEMMETDRGA